MVRIVRMKAIVVLLVLAVPVSAQDLRDRYTTQSLEAAKLIDQTIRLVEAKKSRQALKSIDEAIKADPKCQMAHYWRGIAAYDSGDVEASVEAYKKALSDDVVRNPNISANAATNLALTYARLKEYDDACLWFTRAILEDSGNKFKQRGKAYRNLGITLRNLKKPFAAAVAVAYAYEDEAPNTNINMVREFFGAIGDEEVARILRFSDPVAKLTPRAGKTNLSPATLEGDAVSEAITTLLSDPLGRYVIAWPQKVSWYYVISTNTDKPTVKKVELARGLENPCLAAGFIYGVGGGSIEKIEPSTGKTVFNYNIRNQGVTSLAVLPAQKRAYFGAERVIHEVNLDSGAVHKTILPGQVVVAEPTEQFVFSYLRPDRSSGGGHIIVNGRPIYFRSATTDWAQTLLFKAAVTSSGLLIAEVRENACSNANRMSVSPDGQWVAVAGGGGWRPRAKTLGAGYGVAVYSAKDIEHVQGFLKTDAYPNGISFNPVTNQAAALRGADAKIYDLGDPKDFVELKGKFNGASAWSGNGQFLFLGNEKGINAYANTLSDDEQKLASTWHKKIVVTVIDHGKAATPIAFNAVAGYDEFAVASPAKDELAKTLAKILASKRTERPGAWNQFQPYRHAKVMEVIDEARDKLQRKEDIGLVIFQLKKVLKTNDKSVPAKFYLAEALRLNDQLNDVEKILIDVIRADAGRTNLSCLALNALASHYGDKENSSPALYCLTQSLYLDRANPQTIAQLVPILKKQNFTAEAEKIAKLSSGSVIVGRADLPKLPVSAELKKISSAEIYQKATWSVVTIKTPTGSGSGVCVGRNDTIITNKHVVGRNDIVEVYSYIIKDKHPVRMPMVRAQVIYLSEKEDVAVLKLEKALDHLAPLEVPSASPSPGEKVYAIGSPGLGKQILEQSISEGLVSSKNRKIDGTDYLQHSAAVNPGNSGGALLDEGCRVVGIVTLGTRLNNVSFAIPVETLRKIFPTP
jgi:S1-C subfamily serine protease/Tfp pilus assembly protein PilF